MERVLLVTIRLSTEKGSRPVEDSMQELEELVSTCGAEIVEHLSAILEKATANLFIGKGKAEEIAEICKEEQIDTVILSHAISGTQQRNLEELTGRKIIDRTQLILDIFALHAKSPEGQMQVELAQLEYLMPRLVGKGILLSRLGGGIGTRGPGEQKLEIDRRRIRERIDRLKDDLKQVTQHRQTIRKRRKESAIPIITLVGYTNAGKSTLLNTLTAAEQVVHDGLFTTLDTLSKGLKLPNGEAVVVSDTVGFLHDLPHRLIEAFKATLEEVHESDLLVHVLDISDPRIAEHARAVSTVLKELHAEDIPIITALNKIDLLEDETIIHHFIADFPNPVSISAKMKLNIPALLEQIQAHFQSRMILIDVVLPHARMDLVDLSYRQGRVKNIKYTDEGIHIVAEVPVNIAHNLLALK